MHYVCCPGFLSGGCVASSDEDIHRPSNFTFEQDLTSYVRRFGRYFRFSSYPKDFNEEFDEISLSEIADVSFN